MDTKVRRTDLDMPDQTRRTSPTASAARSGVVALVCFLVSFLAPITAHAAEEETHVFNATLSLTGDCAVTALDPVADPYCPDGPRPSTRFVKPNAVAVDRYGNRYVGNYGAELDPASSKIDVFSPAGIFLTEIIGPPGINGIAVDSEGNLYTGSFGNGDVLLYKPSKYVPGSNEIEYGLPPVVVFDGLGWPAVAVNPADDHLLIADKERVVEYGSAADGNPKLDVLVTAGQAFDQWRVEGWLESITVDPTAERLYVSDEVGDRAAILVFDLSDRTIEPGPAKRTRLGLLEVNEGSATPQGTFGTRSRKLGVAADEDTGHYYVADLDASKKAVYEFDQNGALVSTIERSFASLGQPPWGAQIAIDNGPTSPARGFLFVPSGASPGRSYAFEREPLTAPPAVDGLATDNITDTEAILHGSVNPGGVATSYRFEVTTQESFDAEGFVGALVVSEGGIPVSTETIAVEAPVSGLIPGTDYRYRLVATSIEGEDEAEGTFGTYPGTASFSGCQNESLRTGLAAQLPDCRAYELVTPANTNGHPPYGEETPGFRFGTRLSTPDGNALSFGISGGIIPGLDSTGSLNGDMYLAKRGENGWQTEPSGPDGAFSSTILAGSSSEDQGYRFWTAVRTGNPARINNQDTSYLRYPDNHSEVLGQGTLGVAPLASGLYISPGGDHVIFSTENNSSSVPLEPGAGPTGYATIYDRTPDGVVHVVSLLPGEIPLTGAAYFEGVSPNGVAVAFKTEKTGGTIYIRYHNSETIELGNVTIAGFTADGTRVFYLAGGELFARDLPGGSVTPFTQGGDVTVVNLSSDGSTAYFISPHLLPAGSNPQGISPQEGEQNLYVSRSGVISFVGIVTKRDVEGDGQVSTGAADGLGLYVENSAGWAIASAPSRASVDGDVLLFQSRATLTDFDSGGVRQIYRYDMTDNTLQCVSCNPTGLATGEAVLQTLNLGGHLTRWDLVNNLSADGNRAFFESTEALVLGDSDGLRDVYEWEEDGTGSCQTPGGCIYLISSGTSGREDYLMAASDSGDDVFIKTADLLAPAFDPDETPSIYDARVGGGFPSPVSPPGECLGEACQPAVRAPADPTPASLTFQGKGNVVESPLVCPRKKRKVKIGGRPRCVPKHAKHRKHQRKRPGAKGRSHR